MKHFSLFLLSQNVKISKSPKYTLIQSGFCLVIGFFFAQVRDDYSKF